MWKNIDKNHPVNTHFLLINQFILNIFGDKDTLF